MTDFTAVDRTISDFWRGPALTELSRFVALPAKSPAFDPDWEERGWLERACREAARWGRELMPEGRFEVLREPGRTPCLFLRLPGAGAAPVFCYGHLDKQPEAEGWSPGRAPFAPSLEEGRLYGRGAADDGYSFYSLLTMVHALDRADVPRPTVTGLFETGEESGSPDLESWLRRLGPEWRRTALVIVLDSGAADYRRLWLTTSFRGIVSATLRVRVLAHGVHSGEASGLVPSSFMVARALLDRLEDSHSGTISLPAFSCPIPEQRVEEMRRALALVGPDRFPLAGDTRPRHEDPLDNAVARCWRPQLEIIGADGLPPLSEAGNVLRPQTALRLSIRVPPLVDPERALAELTEALSSDPPYRAQVSVEDPALVSGWSAPTLAPWLTEALESASSDCFGAAPECLAMGGSIGLLPLFGRYFPEAQYLVTGVLGPGANAHGPDEMLDLDYVRRLTAALARVLARVPG